MGKDTILAVDLGGTKLLVGEVNREGRILNSKKYASGYLDQDQATALIKECITDYIDTVGFAGDVPERLGVGMVGLVDQKNGVWKLIDHQRKKDVPLAEILEEHTGMQCHIENDVKAAAHAEWGFGGGRGMNDFIYLNVGTGIAAGTFSGGQLVRGWQNDAGEIGHMVVDYTGTVPCMCGKTGCVEAIASGIGMSSRVKALAPKYPESVLQSEVNCEFVRAERIFEAAGGGDSLGQRVAEDALDALTILLTNLIKIYNPEKIIMGGGVAGSEFMRKKLFARLALMETQSVAKGIVLSELDPDTVGLKGAAAAGFHTYF